MVSKNAYPKNVAAAISSVRDLMEPFLRIMDNGFKERYANDIPLNDLVVDYAGSLLAFYQLMKEHVAARYGEKALMQYETALTDNAQRVAAIIPKTRIM